MDNDRNARYGAMTGVISVLLFIVGFVIFSGGVPGVDASAQDVADHFIDDNDSIQIGITVASVGLLFFLWFLGSIRSAIAGAEGGNGRLASIAVASGAASAAIFLVAFSVTAAAAFRPTEVDPTLTRALNDFGLMLGGPGAAALTAFFTATAIAGYRHRALPAPIAGFFALAALCQPLAFATMFTDSGVFAADGVLGVYLPFVTGMFAIAAGSVALVRRTGAAAQ